MPLKTPIFLVFVILLANTVFAANIQGVVYDIELNEVSDAIVKINTTPEQSFVAKNKIYSFDVSLGKYTITAKSSQGSITEHILVKDDGTYNIDLILFPDFEEVDILNETDLEVETAYIREPERNQTWKYLLVFVITLIIFIVIIFRYKKKLETGLQKEIKELNKTTKEDLESDLKELLDFIKKQGNRTTQKDIRRNFPQSEAKISLMIAELEHKGKIKKIKKGRGNIITLT